ncbi:ribosomal RNA small subunit methyltransferase C [Tetragenococcus muriaticus PMC-11-5]|uniref:Ribosomal RNA small subunit methyltransferase C n=1 Tax=Tetragenococcus muriaticus PMC-11-5 TaxID=1302649 RepID=A0A091BVT8_9ENTE|nr:class I SAM-dependent methyltransferase [Tetragenococcus muriaticus]KFN89766.1 ribosomal RNA small subunit methyltransferase C [Tetragenococcus muriaticus PMC-11-5]
MTNHYYQTNPTSSHENLKWSFELFDKTFQFMTDNGVFSKNTVDYGSRVLIQTFSWQSLPEGNILEVGCGYGPIGLAIAYASGRQIEMTDVNERAVDLAKQNAMQNQIKNVDIHLSDVYDSVQKKNYAAILSNPPIRAGKRVVHQIIEEGYQYLQKTGTLTIVIQKKQGAPSAQKKMTEVFGNAAIVKKDKGYYILQSEKRGNK